MFIKPPDKRSFIWFCHNIFLRVKIIINETISLDRMICNDFQINL